MTREGKENRFGRFVFEDEQTERVKAGDNSAVWEFIEDNRKFLTAWARKFIRARLGYMGKGFYEVDEFINQIYVDFPLYRVNNEKALFCEIFGSFLGISCGGYRNRRNARKDREESLEAPLSVSRRSGDKEDGGGLRDLLPSCEPTPYEVIERREHIKEIAPLFFSEIGRACGKNGERFRDIIEEVFFGMSFEEVQGYARKS